MIPTITLLSLLTALTTAAPTLSTRGQGTTFNLLISVTAGDSAVSELNQGIWAVTSNSDNHATLVPDRSKGSLFYEYTNHTSQGEGRGVATGSTGIVITPGGTATVPSDNTVDLVEGSSTMGVMIQDRADQLPTLQFENGSFMACRAKSLDSDAKNPEDIVLSFYQQGQRRFAGCAAVQVISVCGGGGAGSGEVGKLGTPMVEFCNPN